MKKILILLFILLFFNTISKAQFSIDFETGVKYYQYSKRNYKKNVYCSNNYSGIQPNYNINKKFKVGIGFQYYQSFVNFENILDYRYSILEINPTIGYKLSNSIEIYSCFNYVNYYNTFNRMHNSLQNWVKRINETGNVNFFQFGMKYYKKNFFININYSFGLEELQETPRIISPFIIESYLENYRLQKLQIGIGYNFKFHKKSL